MRAATGSSRVDSSIVDADSTTDDCWSDAIKLQDAVVDEGSVRLRPVVVLVAYDRGFIRGEFPFCSRVDAEKYLNIVRLRDVQAWLRGQAGGARPPASLKPY